LSARARNTERTGGERGRIPPSGGNNPGAGDPDDFDPSSNSHNSNSSSFDGRKIIGSRKNHWDEARKVMYDKRLRQLWKLRKRQRNSKGSAHKPKRPEGLGVDPFDSDPKDTPCFIQDVQIELKYFRESLVDDIDKISLVIPLVRARAKKWYYRIQVNIKEDAAIRDKRPFDPNNVLRQWEGYRKPWVSRCGGHSDRDPALGDWNGLSMEPGKIHLFGDELIRLPNELQYGDDNVKDKTRVGMTTDLCNAWAMKTPPPEDYVDYLNLLRNRCHQLEDVASFTRTVVRAKECSHRDKSDDRYTATKKQRTERKGSGPHNPKPTTPAPWSFPPPGSEHAKAHKDIAQTGIDGCTWLNQCSGCADPNHFWRICHSSTPVVPSAKRNHKWTVNEAGHQDRASILKARRMEAPPPAGKRGEAEIRGSAPQILEVDTDASD